MTRRRCMTEKVPTKFGSCYAHLSIDARGRPCGLSFSAPGKADNTELDTVIRLLGEAADRLIQDTNGELK